jgi:hypothetical protein
MFSRYIPAVVAVANGVVFDVTVFCNPPVAAFRSANDLVIVDSKQQSVFS